MTDFADLLARVDALEARAIKLADLPLKALQNSLELNWQPNASLLLGPASITPDMIADLGFTGGVGTATWGGSNPFSDGTPAILHGLGVVPKTIQVTAISNTLRCIGIVDAGADATSFVPRLVTRDGSNPALGTTTDFYWFATAR